MARCLSFFFLFFLFIFVAFSDRHKQVSSIEADFATVRFQKGSLCRFNREAQKYCKKYAAGETWCKIFEGKRCDIVFDTTENKNMDPVEVVGTLHGLWMENITETRTLVRYLKQWDLQTKS